MNYTDWRKLVELGQGRRLRVRFRFRLVGEKVMYCKKG
jgi:hypothetical protein